METENNDDRIEIIPNNQQRNNYGSIEPEVVPEETDVGWGIRHIFAVMAFFGFANVYAMRVNLSVAIVAMTNNSGMFVIITNTIVVLKGQFTPGTKSAQIYLGHGK